MNSESTASADPAPTSLHWDAPALDDVAFGDLYTLEEIRFVTEDGWELVMTRYKPVRQRFAQPLFGAPLLLVHGYTQNRRTWSSGGFVKTMLYFGADLFLLELRGHGKSSVAAQHQRRAREGTELPADADFAWDLDSHLLFDLPAAIARVKAESGYDKIFYCGHSLGGILGYAYATLFDDLMGLIAVGAPSDFGRMPIWLRAAAWAPPLVFPAVDAFLAVYNTARVAGRGARRIAGRSVPRGSFAPIEFRRLPFRAAFQAIERNLRDDAGGPRPSAAPGLSRPLLYQPRNVALSALRPLLRDGGTDESRASLEQFARWLRRGAIHSAPIRHDVPAAFPRIRIPLAIFFGDEDPLATVRTTRNLYRAVSSDYLLWRPVRGNSHIDLTMGLDIRQICYDVRNLMTYALEHGGRPARARRRARSA